MYTLEQLQQKSLKELKEIGSELNVFPADDRRYRENWINAIFGSTSPLLQLLEVSPAASVEQVQPIIETVEASPAAEDVQAQEPPLESKFGRIVYPRPAQGTISPVAKTSTGVEVNPRQEAISQVAKNSPGVEDDFSPECSECFDDRFVENEWGRIKPCPCCSETKLSHKSVQSAIAPVPKNLPGSRSKTSTAHQPLELFKSSAHIIEDSPGVKAEATVSESAIAPSTKISLDAESDPNPILTGIPLSDRFLARYSPPQSEFLHYEITDGSKVDTDGQLSLFEDQVQSPPEPPDPDDFESLDAFREAIARWDREHPSSFDHCSERLPSSVHCEPPDPHDFDSMFAFWAAYDAWVDEADEPLEVTLDSFCLWAPCPEDWYESRTFDSSSKVLEVSELSSASKSSNTLDFFIPTFGAGGDRQSGKDEPPDTGIFVKSPKPKPPNFPPQASWTQVEHKLNTSQLGIPELSRNYPETIPKLFRVVAGSSTQPARSPPGGDAVFA